MYWSCEKINIITQPFEAVAKCKHVNKQKVWMQQQQLPCCLSFVICVLWRTNQSNQILSAPLSVSLVSLFSSQPNIRLIEEVKLKRGLLKRWVTHRLSFSFCLFFLAQCRQSSPVSRSVASPDANSVSHLGFTETLVACKTGHTTPGLLLLMSEAALLCSDSLSEPPQRFLFLGLK